MNKFNFKIFCLLRCGFLNPFSFVWHQLSEEGNGAAQFEEESIYSASNSQYSTASILAMGNEAASNISGANNMRDRANTSRPFIHYNNDDRAVLMQRLEDAERRALSLSSEGARAFARWEIRTIKLKFVGLLDTCTTVGKVLPAVNLLLWTWQTLSNNPWSSLPVEPLDGSSWRYYKDIWETCSSYFW